MKFALSGTSTLRRFRQPLGKLPYSSLAGFPLSGEMLQSAHKNNMGMGMAIEIMDVRGFDADSLGETRKAWLGQVGKHSEHLSEIEFEKTLDWAAAHLDYDNGEEGLAYGIFSKNGKVAHAVIEVVYAKPGTKWLKMLNLTLSPALFLGFVTDGGIDREALTAVYTAAVAGTLKLAGKHPSKTVKLYGRSGSLFTFLQGLAEYLKEHAPVQDVTVAVEGRWLVFRTK